MSYSLFWRSPALPYAQKQTPINVPAGSVVSDAASIRFTGKGASNYGKIQQENQLRLLENFAGPTAPDYATVGQTWYDTVEEMMKVCVSTAPFGIIWKSLSGTQITDVGQPAPTPAQLGDAWFQRTGSGSGVLYTYTGLGRYPHTSTDIGGWNQIWPEVDLSAGRNEYNYMLGLVNQLIGTEVFGGSGAIGRSIKYLATLTFLDQSLQNKWNALLPHDQNVLRDISKLSDLLVEPNSQDWDELLSAARYAVNRLDLPANFIGDLSTVPFVQDGRPAPAELYEFNSTDVRYAPQDRIANVRFGTITLSRLYQQTVNVLQTAIASRYILKGMTGTGAVNPTFSANVTEHPQVTYSAPASSMNTLKTFSLNYNLENDTAQSAAGNGISRFFTAGQALQVKVTYPGGPSAADIDLKAVCETYGQVRLTHDASYILNSAGALSAPPGPGYSALTNNTVIVLGSFSYGSATITCRAALSTSGSTTTVVLYVDLVVASGGTDNVSFDWGFIADDETYLNPDNTRVFPIPDVYTSADLIAPGGIAPPAGTTGVNTPSITAPANNSTGIGETPTLVGTPFSVFGGSDSHASTDWQIFTGPNGSGTIVYSALNDTANKTSITIPAGVLVANSTYYPRARYKGVSFGYSSYSPATNFLTSTVATPTLTNPADGETNISETPTLTSSTFSGFGNDAHASSDWQIWSLPNGGGSLIFSSSADTVNKTSISVPPALLMTNSTYYPRVRHTGTSGTTSAYSAVVSFMTTSSFVPTVVGQPYAGGFYGGKINIGPDAFAIIVAPKATGESSYQWLTNINQNDTWYSTADSTADTAALSRKASPLAAWARGLNIGGFADWQIPASNVLEVMYRNLKPTSALNAVQNKVFSAFTYTGNGGTQNINNGIDLAGQGGLVWLKQRGANPSSTSHYLLDTVRGGMSSVSSDSAVAAVTNAANVSFNGTGFNLLLNGANSNGSAATYASWTFRKAPKFFDTVTYTGDGATGRSISHALGQVPGMILVKSLGAPTNGGVDGNWFVYHRGLAAPQSSLLFLNANNPTQSTGAWNNTLPTNTVFSVDTGGLTNISGRAYVAYLFAHDAAADGLVQCGAYNAGVSQEIILGWKPDFVLVKQSVVGAPTAASDWSIFDSARNFNSAQEDYLTANSNTVEAVREAGAIYPTQNGFFVNANAARLNDNGQYIYMAVRNSNGVGAGANTDVSPSTGNYTTSNPARTTVSTYAGGAETFNGANYWSSTGVLTYQTTDANQISTTHYDALAKSFTDGAQSSLSRDATILARAVRLISAPPPAPPVTYTDDVFSTYLYTGVSGGQTIVNNINFNDTGGMIWFANRDENSYATIIDTERGAKSELYTARDDISEVIVPNNYDLNSFNNNGFTLGVSVSPNTNQTPSGGSGNINNGSQRYVSWSFKKTPKFFDIVTYTGNDITNGAGYTRDISHNLGQVPGIIIIKLSQAAGNGSIWRVYHSAIGPNVGLQLNSSAPAVGTTWWYNTAPTSSKFTLGIDNNTGGANNNGAKYIAYLFANDTSPTGLIRTGSYVANGTGAGDTAVNLGWEPQFIMIKNTTPSQGNGNFAGDWAMFDVSRGMAFDSMAHFLRANTTNVENSGPYAGFAVAPTTQGFVIRNGGGSATVDPTINSPGNTYVYMAIRRATKPPTVGTQVHKTVVYTGTGATNQSIAAVGFSPDLIISLDSSRMYSGSNIWFDRTRGNNEALISNTIQGETLIGNGSDTLGLVSYDQNGFTVGKASQTNGTSGVFVNYLFKRYPGVLDVINYNGTGSAGTQPHGLTVQPEMVIVKRKGAAGEWTIQHSGIPANSILQFKAQSVSVDTGAFNSLAPTSTVINLGTSNDTNGGGPSGTYTAYLFATYPGISKVFSYTGNGGVGQIINCGFAAGARWVMIKSVDTNNNWYVFNTQRGINNNGLDPYFFINTGNAELGNDDFIDNEASGFIIKSTLNDIGVHYIGLAFA
jgi:hypothetical protein